MSIEKRPPPAEAVRQESRKTREARLRRQELRREITILVGLILLGVVAIAVFVVVKAAQKQQVAGPPQPIDGIPCGAPQGNYHEHAHLTILKAGRSLSMPAAIGHGPSGCYYWLHVHASDPNGLIHIEAPYRIIPTLGTFFDIWGQPLSRRQAWNLDTSPHQRLKVYLNQTPYSGNPRLIRLHPHTTVTVEVGPPFSTPSKYKFESGF